MKRFFVFSAIMFLFLAPAVNAVTGAIEAIQIVQTLGVSSVYDNGTITWSGGVTGWILTDTGNFYYLNNIPDFTSTPVTATFTSVIDNSANGIANASFASGTWSISFNFGGQIVANISGHLSSVYNELEVATDQLEGHAVVIVDTATFNNTFWTAKIGSELVWDGVGEQAGIIANTTLPVGTAFDSYAQSYSSDNMIITLYADESQIPEPATIALLGLGALSLIRRKK